MAVWRWGCGDGGVGGVWRRPWSVAMTVRCGDGGVAMAVLRWRFGDGGVAMAVRQWRLREHGRV